jgi:beta-1,4-mannosyltransferase
MSPNAVSGSVVRVGIAPSSSTQNGFVNRFTKAILDAGFQVVDVHWLPAGLREADVIILHWPDEFFRSPNFHEAISLCKILIKVYFSRFWRGTRLIWVAHNAKPHEAQRASRFFSWCFVQSLDGVVFLSNYSVDVIHTLYPASKRLPTLVTVHGHYRDIMVTEPQHAVPGKNHVNLIFFGQIRPYKNLERLVACTTELAYSAMTLTIIGWASDGAVIARIQSACKEVANIHLDVREEPIPDAELEAAIDLADAVILPYSSILNSGAAIMALSRNRPVMAPRAGSLVELEALVGSSWLHLYDGDLSAGVLKQFLTWIRNRIYVPEADLSPLEWGPISESLGEFIGRIQSSRKKASPRSVG